MIRKCLVSELPTIWVSVTEDVFCLASFLLPVTFLGSLDFAGDAILLLNPVLPAGSKSFISFSCSLSCHIHNTLGIIDC